MITRALLVLLAAACPAFGQSGITVMADSNRAVRTNFTLGNAQVTGLSALLDAKLATNGNGGGLTNLSAGSLTGAVSVANGGTGSSSASNARTALGLGTAATNAATAFQAANTNLTALASGDGSSLTNITPVTDASSLTNFPAELLRTNGDGSALTGITVDLTTVLPAYSNNAAKVLAVATNETGVEWIAISNTVTDASSLTNFPTLNQNTTGTASNVTGVVAIANGGTGATNAANARVELLPSYSANASKVLALNTNATDVEWITITNGGGGTSGVTSVDVSGGSTGLTTSGGPITTSGTITLAGTLSIAAGGTGQTNAGAAIEGFLPAYSNNATKVLALNSNATSLEWVTNGTGGGGSGTVTSVDASGGSTGMSFSGGPVTTNGTLTLGGTLAIGNGGTGAGDLTNARINLLPSYTGNSNKVLALNSGGTDLEWVTVASGVVAVSSGGTGATNTTNALINFGLLNTNNGVRLGNSSTTISGVAIGNSSRAASTNGTDGANGVAVGNNAYSSTNGVSVGHNSGSVSGLAIGNGAVSGTEAIAIGKNSGAEPGIAIGTGADAYEVGAVALGDNAYSDNTNGIQIGTGTNSTANSVQFNTWGLVSSNKWAALANSTTFGHYVMAAPTNGTANQVLALNSNATAVVWTTNGGGGGLPQTPLAISNGGTAATTAQGALTNLTLISGNRVKLGTDNTNTSNAGITIGGATALTINSPAVVIGVQAISSGTESVVLGPYAKNTNSASGVSVGLGASVVNFSTDGVAIGSGAIVGATNQSPGAVQIGSGSNSISNTIQFRSAGSVNATEWGYLATASTKGGSRMTNTNGVSATNTIIGYDGTNYTTNTITVLDGIITSWTQ